MKKTIATITAVFIAILFLSAPARADRKTMEGFLLGTGVAILGTAIIHGINKNDKPAYQSSYSGHQTNDHASYRHRDRHRLHKRHYNRGPRGYWSVERVWIEPVYEEKWNPGHYNRHGEWVDSRYDRFIVSNGYWREEKRWIRQ
ncbi:MAG: hypothetical protein ABIJ59_08945 [Pseudomonadota bacterium]